MDAIGLRPIRACAREQPVHLFDVGRLRVEQGLETFRMRVKGMRRLYEREEGDLRTYHGHRLVLMRVVPAYEALHRAFSLPSSASTDALRGPCWRRSADRWRPHSRGGEP